MCGWVYDEAKGIPDEGIIPGTAWADIPEDWTCPVCGSGKEDFEMVDSIKKQKIKFKNVFFNIFRNQSLRYFFSYFCFDFNSSAHTWK